MHDGGFISIGWAEMGDPRPIIQGLDRKTAKKALSGAIEDAYRKKKPKKPSDATRGAEFVLRFVMEMRPGDRVVTFKDGQILGVGVIKGDYEYVRGDRLQPNHRSVLWVPKIAPYPDRLPHRLPPVFRLGRPSDKSLVDYMELVAQSALLDAEGAFDPESVGGARQHALRSVALRRGQSAFRAALLDAYGGRCAITGCAVEAVLEAAHIIPYQGEQTNDVRNGLLLRADIHTLFDLGLIAIVEEGSRLRVAIGAGLADSDSGYAELEAKEVRVPRDAKHHPSSQALAQHRREAGI
jgi:hypothetical protein